MPAGMRHWTEAERLDEQHCQLGRPIQITQGWEMRVCAVHDRAMAICDQLRDDNPAGKFRDDDK